MAPLMRRLTSDQQQKQRKTIPAQTEVTGMFHREEALQKHVLDINTLSVGSDAINIVEFDLTQIHSL